MTDSLRLSKAVIALTGCSRREADLYVEGGWVRVDGRVVEEPQYKIVDQKVELSPGARPEPVEPATLLFNKPAGVAAQGDLAPLLALVTAASRVLDDSEPVQIRSLRRHFSHLAAALPLEAHASGLQVLTQDWQVARQLGDDAGSIEQEYVVEVGGQIAANGLARLNTPIRVKGWPMPAVKVSWQNETRLRVAGKNLDAERISALVTSVDLQIIQIRRIRLGRIAMARLAPGQWRYLPRSKRF